MNYVGLAYKASSNLGKWRMRPCTDIENVPVVLRYAYQLLSASHPYPWSCHLLDAQGESTFLSASAADTPFVPTKPKQETWISDDAWMNSCYVKHLAKNILIYGFSFNGKDVKINI
jgi:hypothetical protein